MFKRFAICVAAALALAGAASAQGVIGMITLITTQIATGAGSPMPGISGAKTYQATGATTAGAGSATVVVQGSNDGSNWDTIGTITLTLSTTSSSDSFYSLDRYRYGRGGRAHHELLT
jgi:hypothetical protein